VALQGVGLFLYHPCCLSHYGLMVGGLTGAERLGFEVNYWGDAVTESLLSAIPDNARGSAVLFGPNLAPFQAPMVPVCSASLTAKQVNMVGWDGGRSGITLGCRYGVFYHRRADLKGIPNELLDAKVLAEQRVVGVWTARVVEFPDPVGKGDLGHLMLSPAMNPSPATPSLPLASDLPSTGRLPRLELNQ